MKKQPKSIPVNTEYGNPQFHLGTMDFITMSLEEAQKVFKGDKKSYYVKRSNKMPVPDLQSIS